jgi:hypothetical protein
MNKNIEYADGIVEPEYFRRFRLGVEGKFEGIDKKFDGIDKRFNEIDKKLVEIDEKLDSHTEMIGELMVKTTQIQLDLRGKANIEYVKEIDERVGKLEVKLA